MVCRELQNTPSAIVDEFLLASTMWKSTLLVVQSTFNNSTLKLLSGRCKLTLLTGQPQDMPPSVIMTKDGKETKLHNNERWRLHAVVRSVEKCHAPADMHKEVAQSTSRRRGQVTVSFNNKTGVRPVNFTTGYFVLNARTKGGRKLQLTWTGPLKVTACRSEHLFEVEDLVTKERLVAQGRRLKHF